MKRDIVVIGGSAGSGAALRAFLGELPHDLPAPILIVMHLSARGDGMDSVVRRAAPQFAVHVAEDGQALLPGHIYVAVPDRHLMLNGERLALGVGPRENMSRPAIDALFRSAALAFGPRVVGVLLSGMLGDGAAGLEAIQACGGAVIVQDPADADADEMPRAALQRLRPDRIACGAGLAEAIVQLLQQRPSPNQADLGALTLEVDIALGRPSTGALIAQIASPSTMSCPACGGVLSQIAGDGGLRFRCQVGHAYSAQALEMEKEGAVDEALRVALRVIEERVDLVTRLASRDGRRQPSVAAMYADRAAEYRSYADMLRGVLLGSLKPAVAADNYQTRQREAVADKEVMGTLDDERPSRR
ncbi:chemotaxis protein CheB [Xanthomonas cannabis]|uniref:chemotaxis protein CheB n=1 Tax=Xanthomonas cannabis TaxID=1885674 RepID=UPI00068FA45E|nr:chemotaxis protein CheB [Xanthomonas cannabis]